MGESSGGGLGSAVRTARASVADAVTFNWDISLRGDTPAYRDRIQQTRLDEDHRMEAARVTVIIEQFRAGGCLTSGVELFIDAGDVSMPAT